MLITLLTITGLSLVVRIWNHRWEVWGAWGVFSLSTFIVLWQRGVAAEMAAALVIGFSLLGFLAPQLWKAIEKGAQKPVNWLWALGIFGLVWGGEFGTFILAMVIFMAGGMYVLRGIFPKKKRKRS